MRQLLQLAVQAVLAMAGKGAPRQLHHHYFHLADPGLVFRSLGADAKLGKSAMANS